MKRYILICIAFISFAAMAQEKKVTWDYPVKPGIKEWSQFESMEEMYKSCQIPETILKEIDTECLADLCLKFPATPVFPLFNTPQDAFLSYYSNFNGIRELFNRKDAGHYLLKKYAALSLSGFNSLWPLYRQGQFISHYKFVEAILAQTPIIQSLNTKERKLLLKEAILKLDEKKSKTNLFSGNNLGINLWVIGKVLDFENKLFFQIEDQQNIQTFLETGFYADIDINSLYQQAKKYTYENETEQ
jgi:hypothetical protein